MGQRLKVAIRPGDGTRTPLLLCNGIGANLELLQPFVDALDPAIEVIRFDVPGVGGSPTPPLPLRFPALAWLTGRMLDQLGYARVDALGISWGGALAQQFALQHRWRCRRLVLVSTATGAIMVPGKPSVLAKMATPRRYFDPTYMASIAGIIYGGSVRPEIISEYAPHMRPGDARGYFYQILSGSGWTSVPWLPCLRQRTLILSGDSDPLIPPVNARLMHHLIPRSRLHIFHGGHLGIVVQARELAPLIGQFLAAPSSA
jgi:poly(3-hydroxyalkanoate) depolymerase